MSKSTLDLTDLAAFKVVVSMESAARAMRTNSTAAVKYTLQLRELKFEWLIAGSGCRSESLTRSWRCPEWRAAEGYGTKVEHIVHAVTVVRRAHLRFVMGRTNHGPRLLSACIIFENAWIRILGET
jgi:hypothetical protein